MPGLLGFVADLDNDESQRLLAKMACALKEEDSYRVELHHESCIALGRVSLGLSNPEIQPVWNEDRSLCLFMEGEVYDYGEWKRRLQEHGHRFATDSDAEFVLHLFEELGDGFAVELNGAFVVAIWNRQAKQLIVANDRLGLHPLYYAHYNGKLAFASGVRALLADPALPRSVDLVTLAQILTFDHALHDGTLLSAVRALPGSSLMTFQNGTLDIRPYWRITYPNAYELRGEDSFVEELTGKLRNAVDRQIRGHSPTGLLLSGGLDSRVLLALLADGTSARLAHTFTWGIPGCDDARYAKEVAAKAGVRHHFFPLPPDYPLRLAEKGVRITDGLQNCIHMHSFSPLQEEARYAQVIFKGFMGDALMGFGIDRQYWTPYAEGVVDADEVHYHVYKSQNQIVFEPEEHSNLFVPSVQHDLGNAVREIFRATITESQTPLLADQRHYFDLRQRVPRMTIHGVQLVRNRAVVRTPFCDNDLVDFILTAPPWLRSSDRYLMKKAFVQAYPDLAKTPITETHLPLVQCAGDVLIRFDNIARWRLRQAGAKWIGLPQRRPYADYNSWMRSTLRHWVEKTLLSKRALERGYFQPEYIRGLVADHMAGAKHARRLGALLTVELWHRQYLD